MNVSHDHRFVFFANHRTATRSVFRTLHDHYGCRGPEPRPNMLTHSIGLPHGTKDYLVVATVRHPGTRLVSIWYWMKAVIDGWPDNIVKSFVVSNPDDFPGFVEVVSRSNPERGGAFEPQVGRFSVARFPDYLIHIERLQDDFAALPFVRPSGRVPKAQEPVPPNTGWESFYTPSTLQLMREIYKTDFERLGY